MRKRKCFQKQFGTLETNSLVVRNQKAQFHAVL